MLTLTLDGQPSNPMYIPPPEKLTALGFAVSNAYQNGATRWMRWDYGEIIVVRQDGKVRLTSLDMGAPDVVLALPSETFFDQLLTAVGWQPA